MPELGTYGSVRGAPSNGRPYRDRCACGAPAATVDNAPLRGCVAHRRRLRPHAHSLRLLKIQKGTRNDNNLTSNIPS
jgi:hypothetical protein